MCSPVVFKVWCASSNQFWYHLDDKLFIFFKVWRGLCIYFVQRGEQERRGGFMGGSREGRGYKKIDMCFGWWSEVPFRTSTNSIAGNVQGIVGNADEVGDMDFDSGSECSYAKSDSAASADPAGAGDLVHEVTDTITDWGSAINQSEYEAAVESFAALEERWLNEIDPSRKEKLKNVLFETEVAFALRFAVYKKIVVGNEDEEAETKRRTRSRMRTRIANKSCIGVPEEGRASKRARHIMEHPRTESQA